MPNPPNAQRRRPSRSYSLDRDNVEKLDELALRTDQKRSVVLDRIISMVSIDEYVDRWVRRVSSGTQGGDAIDPS
jgi:predicted transcriptional regulator